MLKIDCNGTLGEKKQNKTKPETVKPLSSDQVLFKTACLGTFRIAE